MVHGRFYGPQNPNPFYFSDPVGRSFNEMIRTDLVLSLVLRNNPFSLEVWAKVKIATSGVKLESVYLPMMIRDELEKYQELNKRAIYLAYAGPWT